MANNSDKTGAVLVIGGGIAGIQASLDLADMGYYVHLVEKNPAIGGRMSQLDKTFPTNDCAMCIISPKLNDCGGHININTINCAEVLEVTGEPGRMKAKILKHPRYVDSDKCTACGDCIKVCPVDLPDAYDMNLKTRTAVYKSYAQAFPNSFSITKQGVSPCVITCPANVNAHGYVALAAKGRFQEALEVILDVLPLPGSLGRICAHPCEDECRRRHMEAPMAIKDIKRLVADNSSLDEAKEAFPKSDERAEKVAIIGSGPAGLTCAWHLGRNGIKATIFEAENVAGGAMRLGIPDYRLNPEVLQEEIDFILDYSGAEIKFGQALGRDFTIDDLFAQGYQAVFLATGAGQDFKPGLPGEDLPQIISCGAFLKDVNLGARPDYSGQKVLVVGGGNVAMDVARTAIRLGGQVTAVCREGRSIMPAWSWEVEEAEEEGARIITLRTPKSFEDKGGQVRASFAKMIDNRDPRNFVEDPEGDIWTEDFDVVIFAMGQKPSTAALLREKGLTFARNGAVEVDPVSYQTGREGVFAGGDLQLGASLAINAVAAGKEVAHSILRLLNGQDLKAGRERMKLAGNEEYQDIPFDQPRQARLKMPARPVAERVLDFKEFELGFSVDEGVQEAARCISCGACCQCFRCVKACLPGALTCETHAQSDEIMEVEVGAVVVATGFEPFDPTAFVDTYRYSRWPNVVTAMEFERLLSASGPCGGHPVRPSDGKEPRKVAWLQCVGSREINRCDKDYCSAVCCMYAIKEAVIAKEHASDFEPTIFYMDIRTYGKDFEKYYERAKEKGVRFVRSRIHTLTPEPNGDVALEYITEDGSRRRELFDMVVLSVGLTPDADFNELGRRLAIDLNQDGFAVTEAFTPVSTSRPGIYACGTVNEPKDIPITVMEASAAAGAAAAGLADVKFTLTKTKEYPPERDITGEPPRIGVFVCHCGVNIGAVVDVPAVTEYAKNLPFVELADHNLFTCSQDTQGRIKDMIIEHNLNRVVVCSCSPRTHEATFRETLAQAGLNKFLFEMANIRDQNSWVHQHEPEKATQKAKDLLRGAVAKAALLYPMHQTEVGLTKEAVVVGGGVAGMIAALNLAGQGFPVHLIEKSGALGGNALKVFPRGKDVRGYAGKLASQVQNQAGINVYLNSEVVSSSGFLGNFETVVRTPDGEKTIKHGATIMCAGGRAHEPSEYLYKENDRVLLSLDMDELLATDDPIVRNGRSFAFIQCVGSREPERPYCSKICCTHSIESALMIKERNPEAQVYILYRDIRTYGFKEKLYKEARSKGVIFIRYEVDDKPVIEASGDRLSITVKDHVLGRPLKIEVDRLTLASGVNPNDIKDLVEAFKGQRDAEGFLLEAHMKLRPVDQATDGQYLAGLTHYPKPIEETITQAQAAAARATTMLSRDSIMVGGVVAVVDPEKCAVCCTCVRACPVSVPKIVPNEDDFAARGHANIEQAICQGCGVCVSECPGKAISLQFFTDDQVLAKVAAMVEEQPASEAR